MAQTRMYGLPTAEENALSMAEHDRLLEALRRRDLLECQNQIDEHGYWQLRLRAQRRQGAVRAEDRTHEGARGR